MQSARVAEIAVADGAMTHRPKEEYYIPLEKAALKIKQVRAFHLNGRFGSNATIPSDRGGYAHHEGDSLADR
jgi:hypothetical protein